MSDPAIRKFTLRPHDPDGVWESNDARYRTYAHELLGDHEALCIEVLQAWPTDAGSVIKEVSKHPELVKLVKKRDQTSDTVRIYAAMAAEGYLNFYGVLRLGQQAFDDHFERMGLVPKLRALLLVCDQLAVARTDPMVQLLDKLAQSRNALVHPKTIEVGDLSTHRRTTTPMPDTAREAVQTMEAFFSALIQAVPGAAASLTRAAST